MRLMHEQNLAIVKGLVSVAWADGKVAAEEMQLIDGLLEAFGATPSEAFEVRQFAKVPRTIEDVPLTDLSADDRRRLVHHAVLITFVDGHQDEREREVLAALVEKLRIPEQEVGPLLAAAEKQALALVHLLKL